MAKVELPEALVQKRAAMKTLRVNVRLKYSLMADAELNKREPEVEQRFDAAILAGEPLQLTIGALIDEI